MPRKLTPSIRLEGRRGRGKTGGEGTYSPKVREDLTTSVAAALKRTCTQILRGGEKANFHEYTLSFDYSVELSGPRFFGGCLCAVEWNSSSSVSIEVTKDGRAPFQQRGKQEDAPSGYNRTLPEGSRHLKKVGSDSEPPALINPPKFET